MVERSTTSKCHDGKCELSSSQPSQGDVEAILYVGIDLAKSEFAVRGVNETGAVLLRQPKVARAKLGAMAATTMIYTHVLKLGGGAVRSPIDTMPLT